MINLTPIELKTISEGLEIAIGTFEHEDYMEISGKWSRIQKKIDSYLGSVKGAIAQTKQIKDTANKLPKKKLKLEDVSESTKKELMAKIRKLNDIIFNADYSDDEREEARQKKKEIEFLFAPGIKDVKKETKQIRDTATKLPKKKMKLEGNMEFEKYLEEKELEKIDKQLDEDAASFIGSVLGYSILGSAGAFGGTLLILGGVKAIKGLIGLWKRIVKNVKSIFKPSEIIREVKTDARVNKVKQEMVQTKDKYEDELKYVFLAITNKDFNQAKEEFVKLPPTLQNNPDVYKSIITEITKSLRMPPIYLASPGNKSYQAIKKVVNIRVARAAAAATSLAFQKATEGE